MITETVCPFFPFNSAKVVYADGQGPFFIVLAMLLAYAKALQSTTDGRIAAFGRPKAVPMGESLEGGTDDNQLTRQCSSAINPSSRSSSSLALYSGAWATPGSCKMFRNSSSPMPGNMSFSSV